MKNLIIIAGPTGVGKTKISIKVAEKLNCEIISADSMQIYKFMDIGSAKVTKNEMKHIKHHMIDIINPNQSFSVSQYKKMAEKIIDDIISTKKIPMLVGGTGLYINSIICNYNFASTEKDQKYRDYLSSLAKKKGKEYVHSLLKNIDIESYNKLFPNDLKRVIRALEVYKMTGKPISEFINQQKKHLYDVPYKLHYFVLTMNRKKLYDNINTRVDNMIKKGLIEEVKKLKENGCNRNMQSMKGIGYKEILDYLDKNITLDEAIYLIKKSSRNYAKRQLTWFRKDPRAIWINKDEFSNEDEIVNDIVKKIMDSKC